MREDQLTISCANYLRYQYPSILFWHTANERSTSPQRGAKLKKMGVLSGVPDIAILYPNRSFHGLFIELKVKGNKPTFNQICVIDKLNDLGYMAMVAYDLDEFIDIVDQYLQNYIEPA